MPLSEKIKTCRRQLQYTQQEVASALGVSKRSIIYYEAGQRCPSLAHLSILAKLFCVPVLYLISDSNTDKGQKFLEETYRRELYVGSLR